MRTRGAFARGKARNGDSPSSKEKQQKSKSRRRDPQGRKGRACSCNSMQKNKLLNRRSVLGGWAAGLGVVEQNIRFQKDEKNYAANASGISERLGTGTSGSTSRSGDCVAQELGSGDYFQPGPYKVSNLKVEHTCSICFPRCLGDQCIIRVHMYYPAPSVSSVLELNQTNQANQSGGSCDGGGGGNVPAFSSPRNTKKPWPLAIISSGFLVNSDQYRSYAQHLASYGYIAVLYDKVENISSTIDDETSALFVSEIINWLESSSFREGLQTKSVYAVGHSRGGKISLLAAENDERIGAVCLVDPVDSNEYAPEGPGFPSAVKNLGLAPTLPIAIIGGGHSEDCIPMQSNYKRFFEGSQSPTMLCSVKEAGHFQYLDKTSMVQSAVCSEGKVAGRVVRDLSKAIIVAWAEIMLPQQDPILDYKNRAIRIKNSVDKWEKTNVEQGVDVNFELKGL